MQGWTVCNLDYHMGAGISSPTLPNGIYKLVQNPRTQELYLTFVQDQFSMPDTVYDLDSKLIQHVHRYYNSVKSADKPINLGVLLAGVKGSGKTVTAKQLCNTLGLPAILITHAFANLASFINDIKQDVLFLVDEYEKIFAKPNQSVLLTVMDGAMENGFKRIFLLTINETSISDNLLERPGRIRYFKQYEDLTLDTIKLVLENLLINKQLMDETTRFISELQTITIDIIKAIVEEVNLCNESPYAFASVFNVKKLPATFDLYEVLEDKKQVMAQGRAASCLPKLTKGYHFYVGQQIWTTTTVLSDRLFRAQRENVLKTFLYVERKVFHSSFQSETANGALGVSQISEKEWSHINHATRVEDDDDCDDEY